MAVRTRLLDDDVFDTQDVSRTQLDLFRSWDRSGGHVDEQLHESLFGLADELVLFGMPMETTIPEITHVGHRSLAGRVMGTGWRNDLNAGGGSDASASGGGVVGTRAGALVVEGVVVDVGGGEDAEPAF